jgi:homogentisate 1,2-dioxygenase
MSTPVRLMPGFGNDFETEALPGALPQGQNSPQRAPYGLYAEQLSGSPFTAPRGTNERSWLYRIRPSVLHVGRFRRIAVPAWATAPHLVDHGLPLGPLRWDPVPLPSQPTTFLDGLRTMTTCGDALTRVGMAAHVYLATTRMVDEVIVNADGELLLIPQLGRVEIVTELGIMQIGPGDLAVVPRGIAFRVDPIDGEARGYACENYGATFTLPNRGPIGANCLANPRDFKTPVAAYEDRDTPYRVVMKWCGSFQETWIDHSPLDVVAWHGNYAPYQYDLRTFSPVGAILFDHPDPSIFTVLTAPSGEEGTANVDLVLFPERWQVAEHSFRPPWYHRNIMSEFMGLVFGRYDAKAEGFVPGGMSLHNSMLPHGPDSEAFEKASRADLAPVKLTDTLAFMFETRFPQQLTHFAAREAPLQAGYAECWSGLRKHFDPARRDWPGP